MQGTSLEEVFGSFGLRAAPAIPLRDMSGSILYQVHQEQLRQSLTEDPPILDTLSLQMQTTVTHYKTLKNSYKCLTEELVHIEKTINDLEAAERQCLVIKEYYNNHILHNGVLSKLEFDTLQQKQRELRDLEHTATVKCLTHYKEELMKVTIKHNRDERSLAVYDEFMKSCMHEMTGTDVN
jgi:hypothetical protein